MDTKGYGTALKLLIVIIVFAVLAMLSNLFGLSKNIDKKLLEQANITPSVTATPTTVLEIKTANDVDSISDEIDKSVNQIDSLQKDLDEIDSTSSTTGADALIKELNSLKTDSLTRAKELASNIFTNQFLAKLNTLRAQVSANEKLGVDAKQVILAKVDSEITWFTLKKDEVATMTMLQQLQTAVSTARDRFHQSAKEVRKLHITSGFVVVLENVANSLEKNFIPKIEIKLLSLSATNVDVTVEQALLDNAMLKITSAKSSITATRNSTTIEAATKNFESAKGSLKNARQDIKELLSSLKLKLASTK